ncbi:unnamed protein product [Nezara viridula]|uniref:Uncharacterized protein n=1 Tax=Nezara viridula TaxID=85310 RepID=A0A9P0HTS0_NEZVI|nr:unnamed protein product [Nezara viridula]
MSSKHAAQGGRMKRHDAVVNLFEEVLCKKGYKIEKEKTYVRGKRKWKPDLVCSGIGRRSPLLPWLTKWRRPTGRGSAWGQCRGCTEASNTPPPPLHDPAPLVCRSVGVSPCPRDGGL